MTRAARTICDRADASPPSGVLAEARRLASRSVIYGAGAVLARGAAILLLPLYTLYLTPADYGVIAAAATTSAVLGVLFPLGLHGALARFHFDEADEAGRRRTAGTLWLAMIGSAAAMAFVAEAGGAALLGRLFRAVPYAPYLRLAVWIAFFNSVSLLPLGLLQIRERAPLFVALTLGASGSTAAFIIGFVVFGGMGATGYLGGMLASAVLLTVPYGVLMWKNANLRIHWPTLKAALGYSLPLVPHGLAGWLLSLSDRVILERYAPLSALGLYAIAGQFGVVMSLVTTAVNSAWVPLLFRADAERGKAAAATQARLVTYYAMGVCWLAIGLALFARVGLVLLTARPFHAAHALVPWIVVGWLFNGLYLIPANFLFLKSRTGWLPVASLAGGCVSVSLNLALAPIYGTSAAAWATVAAFGTMLVVAWAGARRAHSFPYEYKRLAHLAGITTAMLLLGLAISSRWLALEALLRALVWVSFPALLAVTRFFTRSESQAALGLAARVLRAGR